MFERRKDIEQQRIDKMYQTAAENMLRRTQQEIDDDLCVEGTLLISSLLFDCPRMWVKQGKISYEITDKEITESVSFIPECHRNARLNPARIKRR